MSEGVAVLPPKLCSPVVLDPVLAVEAAIVPSCALPVDQPSTVVQSESIVVDSLLSLKPCFPMPVKCHNCKTKDS